MRINLEYASSVPMYKQIKSAIKENIYNGQVKDQEMLPSVRQLAKELNVSMITVKRAYADLEYEGLVSTVLGRGTFVKLTDYTVIRKHRQDELLMKLREDVNQLRLAGIDEEEVIQLVIEEYSIVGGR